MGFVSRRVLAGFVLTTASACGGYPSAPADLELVVHGMLVADTAPQEILVERTRPVRDGLFRGLNPLPGTRVSLAGPGGEIAFMEDPAQAGLFRASFIPRAGDRFTLLVEGPGGERVTAETLVPERARLLAPTRDTAVVALEEYRASWTGTGPGYVISQGALDGGPSSRGRVLFRYTHRDTTALLALDYGESGHLLRIAAVDANYVRYTQDGRYGDLRPQTPLRSEVQGGYGVFASVAFSEARRISLRERGR